MQRIGRCIFASLFFPENLKSGFVKKIGKELFPSPRSDQSVGRRYGCNRWLQELILFLIREQQGR
jgi:hypothetical protein